MRNGVAYDMIRKMTKDKEGFTVKKAILFDLDGTLTDSGEGIINCAQYAFQQMGYPVPPREEMGVFVGPPLWDTFEKFGIPKEQTDEAVRIFRSRYVPIGKFENTPYPGIRELLERLKEKGFLLYVATSKPETTAAEILEHFDLAKYFNRICGADLEKKRNSKDAVIEYLLGLAGSDADMIMVGDTEYDVLGAAAHGIPTIGVSWGYGDVAAMRAAGAKAIADTMQALEAYLTEGK